MKKTLLILFQLHFIFHVHAQKIHFTDSNNRWTVMDKWGPTQGWDDDVLHLSYDKKDTVINGQGYRVSYFGYIREDTIANKVYVKNLRFYPPNTSFIVDTNEFTLYDYNLQLNDTITYAYPSKTFTYVVANLSSTQINGMSYKVWFMSNLDTNISKFTSFAVIEGIGSVKGPFFPAYPYEHGNIYGLGCFQNDGGFPQPNPSISYGSPLIYSGVPVFDNYVSCAALSVDKSFQSSKSIPIVPNPANENSRIVFPYTIQSGILSITNIMGQSVAAYNIRNEEQVFIGKYLTTPGIYFFRVTDNQSDKTFTGKFVYNN